jgi:hypothetical protein
MSGTRAHLIRSKLQFNFFFTNNPIVALTFLLLLNMFLRITLFGTDSMFGTASMFGWGMPLT